MDSVNLSEIKTTPLNEKLYLTIKEAAEYSNIGVNKLYELVGRPDCPFALAVGKKKKIINRRKFEKYLENRMSI